MARATAAERLAAQTVAQPNGCLEWTGPVNDKGYGVIWFDGRSTRVHRMAWILAKGPIPKGKHVLHRCDNPPCHNVEKCLFLGTNADNVRDREDKGRSSGGGYDLTQCLRGHDFNEANTYIRREGRRMCRACATLRRKAGQGANRIT